MADEYKINKKVCLSPPRGLPAAGRAILLNGQGSVKMRFGLASGELVGVIPVIGSGPEEKWGWCKIMEVGVRRRIGELVGGRHRVNGRGPGVLGAD